MMGAAYAEGEKITDIRVKGNRRIEAAVILNVLTLKPGDSLYSDKTDADLRAIYRLGHFQDVQVSTEETAQGVVLIYTVQEKPVVRDIRFEGNKELKADKLKEGMELRQNSVFSTKDLDRSVARIKKLYADEGFYLVEVSPVIEKQNAGELAVTFKINEGKKILIRSIRFDGNQAFSDSKLRGVMETKEKWFLSWLTGAGTYKEEVLKNDALLIADHYLNNGYVNIKVGEPVVKMNEAKDALEVTVGITEGDQYRVGEIDFKGELLEPASELRKKLKVEQGEVFSRAVLRADISTLTDVYGDKGYAFANVNPVTKIEADKKIIDLTFDMEKGQRVHIERIAIAGNPKTRDKVIRRELRVTEGETYSATGMKRSKQNLMNLGFFEEANVATAKGSASDKLNVTVDVKEKPTGTFSIGGGYSSLDGLIGQGSVQQANFLGLGLRANVSASIGGKSQTYSLGIADPHFMDTKWNLGMDIYRSERDYIDYSRRLTGGDIKAGYPINDFIGTFFLYKYEIKDIFNPIVAYQTLNTQDPVTYPLGTTTTSSILGSITRNVTDYRLDPTTGMINSFSAEFAGLGGNNKFARYVTDHTWFHPLTKKVVFSTKLTLGYIQAVGSSPVPIDEKFYLGGIFSLRGYKARTVSPVKIQPSTLGTAQTISDEKVYLGGNKEAFGNVELTFPLLSEFGLKGVAFFDYGNSYGYGQNMFSSILMSYGGGIRWASPIGPLRLEYGIPVNPRNGIDSNSGRLEFSIGSMF
ncbi:outer membrane protein assembly factor BamA [Geobacter sp. SVR]|uniref:outer membrane protein assembly factor BamA n=1 Tax=Geobacter sp. SVR TaxID=2495594 RepID=UPI00143F0331|nr:outer membrane protein assembly factor BamA [Geobacter sp. SVR]BCS52436.1 outer membrane protein assembly factor BamA [Geobacter sp. SVR]GCF87333.1 outer membrane protein assembly factor BamA [Geobacter sp. SVR]